MWPTPNVPNGGRKSPDADIEAKGSTDRGKRQIDLASVARYMTPRLWSTAAAGNFNDAESPESWRARAERLKEKGINGNGAGTPLAVQAKEAMGRLWATPRQSDWRSGQVSDETYEKNSRPLTEQATRWMQAHIPSQAPWVPCQEMCGAFWCAMREMHAHDCECPPIEDWETDPYSPTGPHSPTTPMAGGPSSNDGPGSPPPDLELNPAFVEWLMLGPAGIGLTCLGHPATATAPIGSVGSATGSARPRRRRRSEPSGIGPSMNGRDPRQTPAAAETGGGAS